MCGASSESRSHTHTQTIYTKSLSNIVALCIASACILPVRIACMQRRISMRAHAHIAIIY